MYLYKPVQQVETLTEYVVLRNVLDMRVIFVNNKKIPLFLVLNKHM